MWISITDLPPEGRAFTIDDQSVWTAPMKEFGITGRILSPLKGKLLLIPQLGGELRGCLVRGRLTGEIMLPCDRCAEDARVAIDSMFEDFEPFPADDPREGEEDDLLSGDAADKEITRLKDGVPQINPEALLWEEFSLALPMKPLCRPDCKGLCAECGQNLNVGDCSCGKDEGDPRLAVLRNLMLTKKQ